MRMRCLNADILSDVSVNEYNVSRSKIWSRFPSSLSLTSMLYSSKKIKIAVALILEEISSEVRFSHGVGNFEGLNFN
jgi:hypothetical protein